MSAVAALTAVTVAGVVDRAERAEARFGRTRSVVVARRSLVPGDAIGPRAMKLAQWPASLVPHGALSEIPDGRVATANIAEGEVVVTGRVSGRGASGAAGLVPPGHRAMAVPLLVPGLPVRPGDRVDVYVSDGGGDPADLPVSADGGDDAPVAGSDGGDRESSHSASPALVAEDAVVIEVGEQSVTVAVASADAPTLAAAIPSGTLIVALAGPPS